MFIPNCNKAVLAIAVPAAVSLPSGLEMCHSDSLLPATNMPGFLPQRAVFKYQYNPRF